MRWIGKLYLDTVLSFGLRSAPKILPSYCHTVLLSYCLTVLLSYCPTVILSYCHTVILSYCPTVLLSYCLTVKLSYCHTVLLSYCLTVTLSHCQTVLLSYCHTFQSGQRKWLGIMHETYHHKNGTSMKWLPWLHSDSISFIKLTYFKL